MSGIQQGGSKAEKDGKGMAYISASGDGKKERDGTRGWDVSSRGEGLSKEGTHRR